MLNELLPAGAFAFILLFVRVGAVVMLLPGVGEMYVPAPVRLALALAISVLLAPVLGGTLPPLPSQPLPTALLVGVELFTGIFIGLLVRFLVAALSVAGNVIAVQSGLGAATFFDPIMATQNVVFANFLSIVGVTALFVTDLHLMLLRGAVDSYALFPAGLMPMAGDAARHAGDMVSASFRLGIQISAPFIVFGLVFNVGLGLLNRLMPAFQVFFVMTPVQMALSFLLFAITLAAGTSWFLEHVEAGAAQILAPR